MAQQVAKANKDIQMELGDGSVLQFNMTRDIYVKFLNETLPNDKYNAMHNMLARSVTDDSKEKLLELLENPANCQLLVSSLIEEYQPDIQVVVKKSKAAQTK